MEKILKGFWFLVVIAAIASAQGCASRVGGSDQSSVEDTIAPYFQRFEDRIGVSTEGISGATSYLSGQLIGQCTITETGARIVEVDANYWSKATDSQKEETIFHELGHCAMGLGHNAEKNSDGCPVSIMYPYALGNSPCYLSDKPWYYQELESHK